MASHTMFTPETQYSKANIQAFEATFGDGFMSAGGLESTVEMARLIEPVLLQQRTTGSSSTTTTATTIRVLDVGCGIGGAAFYFASTYGVHVDGRDINPIGIDMANQKAKELKLQHLVNFQVMDVTKAVTQEQEQQQDEQASSIIANQTYDVIYSRDALLHVPHADKPAMYRNFYAWLKPLGVLVVGDYSIGPKSAKTMDPTFQDYLDQRGYHLHSIPDWHEVLVKAGFHDQNIAVEDRALWYCQTCQREVDQVAIPGSDGHDKILQQFSPEKLQGLMASYRDKIAMTLRGDRSYAIVTAYKTAVHGALRQDVCRAYRTMSDRGWIMSCDGNASVRVNNNNNNKDTTTTTTTNTCLVTPSGVAVQDLDASKVVWVDTATGKAMAGERYKPTSEVALHTMIYQRRPDVGAIVHSHSIYACALACCRIPLPPSHYAVCELLQSDFDFSSPQGGSTTGKKNAWQVAQDAVVQCAPYHTYGTRQLAKVTADALGQNFAVLMAAHGAIVTGSDMDEALYNCERLERECEIYWRAVQLSSVQNNNNSNSNNRPIPSLTAQEIHDLHAADRGYGQEHPDVCADDAIAAAAETDQEG